MIDYIRVGPCDRREKLRLRRTLYDLGFTTIKKSSSDPTFLLLARNKLYTEWSFELPANGEILNLSYHQFMEKI